VIAGALIATTFVAALFAAASLRLESAVLACLAVYLMVVTEITVLTTALSPFQLVTRHGLAVGEAVLLIAALTVWWLRGRPGLGLMTARTGLAEIARDPVVVVLAVVSGVALAYELLLVFTVPPNNWDSLTYHLARAAAWAQHGGLHWITDAPTARMNEFQPLAEQEILFLFVATGEGALFALPQYVAQLAIVTGIYGAARCLGFARRPSAAAALLFPTFTLVALESTTAQNDLVAASFPMIAAALILRGRRVDLVLAGLAIALGLGVKLTTALVLPVLLALAVMKGWRSAVLLGSSSAVAFASLGMWGYVRNVTETGQVLGEGTGRIEHTATPSLVGTISTAYRIVYHMLDLSGFGTAVILMLAGAAVAVLVASVALTRRRGRSSTVNLDGATTGVLVLLSPVIVLGTALLLRELAAIVDLPVNAPASTSSPFTWDVSRGVTEDYSAFGPLVGIGLLALVSGGVVAAARRKIDPQHVALAFAFPVFVVLLALTAKYNPWISRFMIIPLVLTMPLCAAAFRHRTPALAIVAVAALTVGLAHLRNVLKPIEGSTRPPWKLTQVDALSHPFLPAAGVAAEQLEQIVPSSATIGALLDADDPSYLLYGPALSRRVTYLPIPNESEVIDRDGIDRIVIHTGDYGDASTRLRDRGWTFQPLGTYWTLAMRPQRTPPSP
jgi:hypothetical protein